MSGIRQQMARGAAWMLALRVIERSAAFASTLVLARLLVPADFGLVAMATSLIAILEIFSAFGVDVVIIQRSDATREHYDTAWTLNILVAAVVAALMVLLAWPVSQYYRDPRLISILCLLAIGSLAQGFENIGVVQFRKDMNFRWEFYFVFGKRMATLLLTIPLAIYLRNFWALVIGTVAGRFVGIALSFWMHAYRPRFSLQKLSDFVHFSKWLIPQNLLTFMRERGADFIVGRMAGAHSLGILNAATEISNIPGGELVAPINRALLPAYAKLAGDPEGLRREYLSVMAVIILIAIPAIVGLAAVAPYAVGLLLGPQWHEVVPILSILAFFGVLRVVSSNAYAAFLAIGRPDIFVRITAVNVVILVPLLIVMTKMYGLVGAAWAYVIAAFASLAPTVTSILRTLALRFSDLFAHVWRPIVSSVFMYVVLNALTPEVNLQTLSTADSALQLALFIPLGAVAYVGCVMGLWYASGRPEGAEAMMLRKVLAYVGPRLRAGAKTS
ncbi:MAG TPA: oligosaccharide flippase family protein [Steroidobacteraceae bacterium]|nr:oligosaccharide flippase family protein [Steroidobacteraceae bacterium]